MVGRDEELEAVERFVARRGGPGALMIEGGPGIGKTTLWRAGLARAQLLAMRVLEARPVQAEAELAFAGLEALLGDVIDELLHGLPAPQRAALEVALVRTEPGDSGPEARAVASATLSVLRRLAEPEPLLIAIDDWQWLDGATSRVLAIALSRLRAEQVLLLAASRDERDHARLGLERELVTRIRLGGLDAESIRGLVSERFACVLSMPAARRLTERSGGNPYYALELANPEHARSRSPATAPADVLGLAGQRLTPLSDRTRAALGTLAALAHPRTELIAELLGDESVLDSAFAAGVLHEDGAELRFTHPLLAASAYHALAPAHRRAVHRQLAAKALDPVERARHLAAATIRASADSAHEVERGAWAAASRGAPTIAADLFEEAARLAPAAQPETSVGRRLEAVRQLFAAGEGMRALERGRELLEELRPGDLRARVLTTMAWSGKVPVDEAIAMCEQAIAMCRSEEARAGCLLLFTNTVQTRDAERARDCARTALELLRDRGAPPLRVWALAMLGAFNALTDPTASLGPLREASALEQQHGTAAPDAYFEAGTQLGIVLLCRDELDEARELLTRQHAKVTLAGREASASTIAMHLAELEIRSGNLDRARTYGQDALAIEDEGEPTQTLGAVLSVRAHVAALDGDVELATSLAQRGLQVGRVLADRSFPIHNQSVLGSLALALGDAKAAVEHLHSLLGESRELGFNEPGVAPFTSDLVDALIAAGRLDEASAINSDWEQLGRRLDRPRLLATGARASGLLAAARGDLTTALAILERALAHHDRLPVPHERARTLLAYGSTLRRAGRRRAARSALDQASAIFASIGQPLWAQRVADEAARVAGRRVASADLTSTERQVAELVAAGRTNREVAEKLFITVRTVEANLTRIYRKVGLRSRAELAAQWNQRHST
jgi:DNA-binding CsgD family transcriptional regulator